MRALWNNTLLAESNDTVLIEGNHYFPPESVKKEFFTESDTPYTCPWKGETQYFTVTVNGDEKKDAAWSYPEPIEGAVEKVGQDFASYVAFDVSKGIEVAE